jgi:hypothetical protein
LCQSRRTLRSERSCRLAISISPRPAKWTQFHQLRQARFGRFELAQRFIEVEQVGVQAQLGRNVVEIGDALPIATALVCEALAGVVDHDAAHRGGGIGEEVGAIVVAGVLLPGQPQPGLMHQAGGVEGGILVRTQLASRQHVQFPIQQPVHAIQRLAVAGLRRTQPLRDVVVLHRAAPGDPARS